MITPEYNFYKTKHGGRLSEEEFNINIQKATLYLEELTHGRNIPANMTARVLFAACELADFIANQTTKSGVIKSETVDGYSVTYDNAVTQMKAQVIAQQWLTFPVNLIYSGR